MFFDHQTDPEATEMAAFPARGKDQFAAHWARTRAHATTIQRTIVADGTAAGDIASWEQDGQRLLADWIGRDQWGPRHRDAGARAVHAPVDRPAAVCPRRGAPSLYRVWRSAASGAIAPRRRQPRHPTTASRSSSLCSTRRPGQDGVGPRPTAHVIPCIKMHPNNAAHRLTAMIAKDFIMPKDLRRITTKILRDHSAAAPDAPQPCNWRDLCDPRDRSSAAPLTGMPFVYQRSLSRSSTSTRESAFGRRRPTRCSRCGR